MLLPATPGWVSLPVVVGGPRHSWLGSAGGGGVWCVAVVCWLLVPRHSWRRFLCATPRHSWLGFAAGGGAWCAVCGVRRVACGGGVCGGFVAGVVGPSPLLAEVPVCYSPPLLAGFRCRWWWAVPATPGWGPLAAVVCGVWRWCVGCWSLATPGGGSCVLLPATPGWVSLPVVVGGPRHSWLGSAGGGGVWCVAVVCWLLVPRHSWRRFLCATPRHSWLGFAAGGGAWCAVCGVRRVACGGGVCGGFVAGVVGPSPLLAEVPVCYSPPLLAGFRCRWWWAVPATPGWGPLAAVVCGVWRWCVGCWSLATPVGGSCVLLPATPGWVSLPVVVGGPRHSWLGSAGGGGVWYVAVVCWLLVPRHSWRRFLCATPRHSWLGFAAGGGAWCAVCGVRRVACGGGVCGGFVAGVVGPSPLLAEVPVCYSPPLLAGFRCRWWWAVPATPGWGPLAAVVCGVWRWCVGCCGTPLAGWIHGVVPTSVFLAYMRVARYACRKPWKGSPMCSQTARRRRCGVLGKAPLTSRDVMMRLMGSMSTTASCINMASNGDLHGMAPHMVGGTARYTVGATCLRMSIHMSLASVVAHPMGLESSGFAQSPFL